MLELCHLYELANETHPPSVHFCSTCGHVLQVTHDTWSTGGRVATPSGPCTGCDSPSECDAEHDFASVLLGQSDYNTRRAERGERALFQQASTIPHFSLGFPKLDSLLRPLSIGDLVVFSGGPSSAVAELATLRAQLPIESGGLDSAVIYVDGGNRSDPYLFSSFAKQKNLEPTTAMRRVVSCRAFTIYQLASLVSEQLSHAVEDYGAKLVVIADILGLFTEPELEEREARRVLAAIEEGIRDAKRSALVVVTAPSFNRYDDIVSAWGDASVHFTSHMEGIRAELPKQRGSRPRATSFKRALLLRAVGVGVPH